MSAFAIGIDFGTESGRVIVADTSSGQVVGRVEHRYASGAIVDHLPGTDVRLPDGFALQDPADHLAVLETAVPEALRQAGVDPDSIVGVGIDCTACTPLPVDGRGTPLCLQPEFRRDPHAWTKLWKHHAAAPEADRVTAVAAARREPWLAAYGGQVSPEWLLPKALEILVDAPELYARTERFIETGDWLVWQLTGQERRNGCAAGYKGLWQRDTGYPSVAFHAAVDPRLAGFVADKLAAKIGTPGSLAGRVTGQAARRTGLASGTPVSFATIDAHASVPGVGVSGPGQMVLVMGTSTCHLLLDRQRVLVPGMSAAVEGGILPELFGYEAGQASVGDLFEWFVTNTLPAEYRERAERSGGTVFDILEEELRGLRPGGTGLLALDWWNGNRSVLGDPELSGLIVGLTVATRPADIYRALIEATAFGTRAIIEAFVGSGVEVRELVACGGLAERNRTLLQIYADVTGRPIRRAANGSASALGAAILGCAAGTTQGTGETIATIAARMSGRVSELFTPNPEARRTYDRLYLLYRELHDRFGRGDATMHALRALRRTVLRP